MNSKAQFEGIDFDGADVVPARDNVRLGGQTKRVFDLMCDGKFRSVTEVARALRIPETSASSQLRNLRKQRFGGHDVPTRNNDAGFYEYRLIPAKPFTQTELFEK